jgi:hypothetical protein
MSSAVSGALAAVTAVLLVLLIAAIFGRIHQQAGENTEVKPLGDRIISGLLALPLIACWVSLVFPEAHVGWALVAPVPLAIYLVLLAGTDEEQGFALAQERFNYALLWGLGIFYVILAVVVLVIALRS